MAEKALDPIPEFETLEDIADFWSSHSTADYDDLSHPVEFEIQLDTRQTSKQVVALLPELSEKLELSARRQGVSVETLVNAWLTEKVLEQA